MRRTFLVRPQAEGDLLEAFLWYEEQRAGLGVDLIEQVERVFDRIREHPLEPPLVHRTLRKTLVRRFPYAVFFTADDLRIDVVAVMHTARDPSKWKRRVE